jgi:hypothetical protein
MRIQNEIESRRFNRFSDIIDMNDPRAQSR